MTQPNLRTSWSSSYQWPLPPEEPKYGPYPSWSKLKYAMADPFPLAKWKKKQPLEWVYDNYASWGDLPRDAAIETAIREGDGRSKTAKQIGDDTHDAVEQAIRAWMRGEEAPEVDPLIAPYLAGAMLFLEQHVERPIHVEGTIFSVKYQFAGTFDLMAELKDGRIAVIDWKTKTNGKRGVYEETALQLTAYSMGDVICYQNADEPADRWEEELPHIDIGYAVALPGEGYDVGEVDVHDPAIRRTVIALRTLTEWDQRKKYAYLRKASVKGDSDAA